MVLAMIGIGGIAFHSSSSDVGLYRLMFNAAWGRCDTRFSFKSKVRVRPIDVSHTMGVGAIRYVVDGELALME